MWTSEYFRNVCPFDQLIVILDVYSAVTTLMDVCSAVTTLMDVCSAVTTLKDVCSAVTMKPFELYLLCKKSFTVS